MKKTILSLAIAFASASAFAQDLTSKKGEPILPEAGDWSIGIDANPVLNYLGNLLNSGINNAPTWNNYGLNQTIVGKMFKDEKNAYRCILRIGLQGTTYKGLIQKPQPSTAVINYPTVPEMVEDKAKLGSKYIGLGAGMEMRRGKTRLQGFYGADAFLWFASSNSKYEYGNALTQGTTADPNVDPNNNSYNFQSLTGEQNLNVPDGAVGGSNGRLIERKSGSTIGIGIRGFIGAEYFIFPKISVGGEFGWGIGFFTQGKGTQTVESEALVSGNETGAKVTTETAGGSGIILDTDRNAANGSNYSFTPSGVLRLNLHF